MLCDQILTDTTYFYLVQPFKINFSDQFPAPAKSTQQFKFSKIQIVLPISCKFQNTLESVNSIYHLIFYIILIMCWFLYISNQIYTFFCIVISLLYLFTFIYLFSQILFYFYSLLTLFFSSRNLVFCIEIIFFSPEYLLLVFFFFLRILLQRNSSVFVFMK